MDKKDISVENWREYEIPCLIEGELFKITLRIEEPISLYISESGSHRVVDKAGVTHWIPNSFINIRWYAPTEPVSF